MKLTIIPSCQIIAFAECPINNWCDVDCVFIAKDGIIISQFESIYLSEELHAFFQPNQTYVDMIGRHIDELPELFEGHTLMIRS